MKLSWKGQKVNRRTATLLIAGVTCIWIASIFTYLVYRNIGWAAFLPFKRVAQAPLVPTNVQIEQDDRAALVTWVAPKTYDYFEARDFFGGKTDAFSNGYYVSWGKQSEGFTNKQIAINRIIQLQPLDNGVPYVVKVQTIGRNGELSEASETKVFTGSSARVDALRQQMTGFFDDFNKPATPFDELKWSTSCSTIAGEHECGTFINGQFHAHSQVSTVNGRHDRGAVFARPREIFDFTNRTGTVTFDYDGVPSYAGRDKWYLTFADSRSQLRDMDVGGIREYNPYGISNLEASMVNLRITQENNGTPYFEVLRPDGTVVRPEKIAGDTLNFSHRNDFLARRYFNQFGSPFVPNVRMHWKFELSKTQARLYVDGDLAASANLATIEGLSGGLPFEKAFLFWNRFSYNTPKGYGHTRTSLEHWDNFGFDAPAGYQDATVTHTYTNGFVGTPFNDRFGQSTTTTVKIPDPINSTVGQAPLSTNLLLTPLTNCNCGALKYVWDVSDYILINGHRVNVPPPEFLIGGFESIDPQLTIPIDPAFLKVGDNALEYKFKVPGDAINVHLELEFPTSTAPSFTQPIQIFPSMVYKPSPPPIGPSFDYLGINAASPISGTFDVGVSIYPFAQLSGLGSNYGVSRYDLYVDGKLDFSRYTNLQVPVGIVTEVQRLDTSTLCNGKHQLYGIAYDGRGVANVSFYDTGENPRTFTTENPGMPSCPSDDSHIPTTLPNPYGAGTPPPAECLTASDGIDHCHDHPYVSSERMYIQLKAAKGQAQNIGGVNVKIYDPASKQLVKEFTDLTISSTGIVQETRLDRLAGLDSTKRYILLIKVPGYLVRKIEGVEAITTATYTLNANQAMQPYDTNGDNQTTLADLSAYIAEYNARGARPVVQSMFPEGVSLSTLSGVIRAYSQGLTGDTL